MTEGYSCEWDSWHCLRDDGLREHVHFCMAQCMGGEVAPETVVWCEAHDRVYKMVD